MFRDLGALHVLNKAEAEACQGWIAPSRIVVIPNGLPYDDYTRSRDPQLARQKWPFLVDRRVMLYLGRLWWQKGLERLVEAWCAAAPNDEWLLVLAGPDYRGYEAKLRSRIADLGAEARIHLTGAVSGDLKESLLAASACFVLPSLGEGFSMALLEAMAAGLPAIYTKECHFSELAAHQGGWEIPQGQTPLSDAILHVCSMAPSTLATVGERARMLGSTEYSAEAVAQKLLHVYRSLV
jgi:glycosyltransferase involved in cell wall biosynthesis